MNQPAFQQQPIESSGIDLDDSTWLIADTHFFHTNIGHTATGLMAGRI